MTSRPDTRAWWRQRARFMQHLLDKEVEQRTAILADYDAIEAELRTLLSVDRSNEPNPTLLSMSHGDLALLADQWRIKYLALTEGVGHGTAQALPHLR